MMKIGSEFTTHTYYYLGIAVSSVVVPADQRTDAVIEKSAKRGLQEEGSESDLIDYASSVEVGWRGHYKLCTYGQMDH